MVTAKEHVSLERHEDNRGSKKVRRKVSVFYAAAAYSAPTRSLLGPSVVLWSELVIPSPKLTHLSSRG